MSSERSEPVGSPVKVVKVCFAYVVKPFTGEVVKVCSGPKRRKHARVRAYGQIKGASMARARTVRMGNFDVEFAIARKVVWTLGSRRAPTPVCD